MPPSTSMRDHAYHRAAGRRPTPGYAMPASAAPGTREERLMIKRVVTPVDGSATAEHALDYAVELARLAVAPIHLLRVVDLATLEQVVVFGLAIEASAPRFALDDERRAA